MTVRPLTRLSIRLAVVLGFGLTLGLWLFAGVHFTQRMSEVEREAAAINARYTRAQDLLSTVRSQVLLASVYVRDVLLDPNPEAVESNRARLEATYADIERALHSYEPFLDAAAERDRVQRLRGELENFRQGVTHVMSQTGEAVTPPLRLLLSRIVAKREIVVDVSEDVQSLNREAFIQQQADLASVYRNTQQRVWRQLGFALAASLAIGLLAALYAGRLENRLRHQSVKDLQNAHDLQRLSAKLITAGEEERRTIARELHDEVGQLLTAIKLELAIAQREIDARGGHSSVLAGALSITDGALHSVRDLSHLLHPALLDDLGLAAAIDWHLRGFGRRQGIRVELLQDRMDDRLPADTETSAFRIVQEALTNVARHARATSCRVYLQRLPNTVLITIEDDGVGFSPGEGERTGEPRGLGLFGIRERVWQLRGTIRLESAPGKGTRLTVELPARPVSPADTAPDSTVPVAFTPAAEEAFGG